MRVRNLEAVDGTPVVDVKPVLGPDRRALNAVPTGVAVFPMDRSIRAWVEREHTVTHWSEFDRGGHFAALEAPDLLVADVRAFFRTVR